MKTFEVTPTKDEDGKETVTLWDRTFDVTGKNTLSAYKRTFKIIRPKKAKKTDNEKTESDE